MRVTTPMKRLQRARRTLWFDQGDATALDPSGKQFTFPTIVAPRFNSPLVNDRNYELSGPCRWEDLIGRVTTRAKPTAFVNTAEIRQNEHLGGRRIDPYEAVREAARRALDAECCVRLVSSESTFERRLSCAVSISGRVADVFDLDALLADYQAYTRRAGAHVAASIADELEAIADCDVSEFLDFRRLIGPPEGDSAPGDWARRGLLLGYPVDTTAAIICEEAGLRRCGSRYVGALADSYE